MSAIPEAKNQWYVVHVLSGQENKVVRNIRRRMESEEVQDCVYEVLMPTERVSEMKGGSKKEMMRKFYPGYVIVNMNLLGEENRLNEKAWFFIQETPGIIGFAGARGRGDASTPPVPMPVEEVEGMLSQIREGEDGVTPSITFQVGESVTVADGPFEGQTGIVEEVNHEEGKLLITIDIFDRPTPVDLHYWQVERE